MCLLPTCLLLICMLHHSSPSGALGFGLEPLSSIHVSSLVVEIRSVTKTVFVERLAVSHLG